jgi:hypothetical protein
MPGGSGNCEDEGDYSGDRDAIPTTSHRRQPATELDWFDLGTSHVDAYEGMDGDNADANEKEEALQADDGSTPNVEYSAISRRNLATTDTDGYECKHGDDTDADE